MIFIFLNLLKLKVCGLTWSYLGSIIIWLSIFSILLVLLLMFAALIWWRYWLICCSDLVDVLVNWPFYQCSSLSLLTSFYLKFFFSNISKGSQLFANYYLHLSIFSPSFYFQYMSSSESPLESNSCLCIINY